MKKGSVLLLLTALLLSFYSCSKDSELSNAIPSDAVYVVKVDAKSLVEKSEYDIFKHPKISAGLGMLSMGLKEDQAKFLEDFLKDSNSGGIDLKGDYFMFHNMAQMGVILKVNNADRLLSIIKSVDGAQEVVEEDGIYIIDARNAVFAWDKTKMILVSDAMAQELYGYGYQSEVTLVEYAKNLLKQDKAASINSSSQYKEFLAKAENKDIVAYYSMDKLFDFMLKNIADEKSITTLTKFYDELKGTSFVYSTNFEKGKIALDGQYIYESAESEKRVKEFMSKFVGTISGEHFKFIPSKPLLITALNLKSEAVLEYITSLNVLDADMLKSEEWNKLETLLKNISGDATFALTDVTINRDEVIEGSLDESTDEFDFESYSYSKRNDPKIGLVFLADVENVETCAALLKTEIDSLPNNRVEAIGDNIYSSKLDAQNTIYFGFHNKLFFATTVNDVYQSIIKNASLNDSYKAEVKDKNSFIYSDLKKVHTTLIQSISPDDYKYDQYMKMISLVNLFDFAELSSDIKNYEATGKVELDNKSDNSLKTICKAIEDLVSSMM